MSTTGTSGYLHVCGQGFNANKSKWYSPLEVPTDRPMKPMDISECSRQHNAVAWRSGDNKACFGFNLGMEVKVDDNQWKGHGHCFVRNKVVPRCSPLPPWLAHPIRHAHHGVNLVGHDGAGLEAGQSFETYTPNDPFKDAGYPDDVVLSGCRGP
jgi:hypothetical protein